MSVAADAMLERMRTDEESDWPDRLLRAIGNAPLVPMREPWRSEAQPLTEQERRTLYLLSVGMEHKHAAEVLGLSVETVATHLLKARRVLAAKNATHAVALAIRQGLIP